MAKEVDGFTFHVKLLEIPAIQIDGETDNTEVTPSDTVNYGFFYQGGVGGGQATEFNIFVYDRSDTTSDTVAAGTPDAPSASTSEKPIPDVTNIHPGTPLRGRPEVPQTLIDNAVAAGNVTIVTNNILAVLTSGVWVSWHRGSFQIVTPSDGYDDDRTTFLGEAQIIYPDQPQP